MHIQSNRIGQAEVQCNINKQLIIYCAMFSFKQKENSPSYQSLHKQRTATFTQQISRSQKNKKITLLRQIYTRHPLEWKVSIETFTARLQQNNNYYSLLLTLFEITQDPLWRNRIPHICLLIQKLHNICAQNYGNHLAELANIDNYHNQLLHIFYLHSSSIQEHFKLLMTIYLSYNHKFQFLDQAQIAIGLLDATKIQGVRKAEYLWIVSQLKLNEKAIEKVIKIGSSLLQDQTSSVNQLILPIVSLLSNYICYETNEDYLERLINRLPFQEILMFGLKQFISYELQRESLLLCNNLLAKSISIAVKILPCGALMSQAVKVGGEQQQFFEFLVNTRRREVEMM